MCRAVRAGCIYASRMVWCTRNLNQSRRGVGMKIEDMPPVAGFTMRELSLSCSACKEVFSRYGIFVVIKSGDFLGLKVEADAEVRCPKCGALLPCAKNYASVGEARHIARSICEKLRTQGLEFLDESFVEVHIRNPITLVLLH